MAATLRKPQISPTGLTQWQLDGPLSLVWPGPGSRLFLGLNANTPGGSLVPIEHPSADMAHQTRKSAAAAAAAFVAAADQD